MILTDHIFQTNRLTKREMDRQGIIEITAACTVAVGMIALDCIELAR